MPDPHVLFPGDRDAQNFAPRKPNARRLNGSGVPRVPGSKQSHAFLFGEINKRENLADRRARRFFQQNVSAVFQRVAGDFVTHLGCRAQRNRRNIRDCL